MAMKIIQHQKISSNQATVVFNNIPTDGTYDDLLFVISARSNRADIDDVISVLPNGSSSNITHMVMRGDGSGVSSGVVNRIYINASNTTGGNFSNTKLYFPNYASSTNKVMSGETSVESNGATSYYGINSMVWANSSPISSMTFGVVYGTQYLANSTFTLYGITASSDGVTTVS